MTDSSASVTHSASLCDQNVGSPLPQRTPAVSSLSHFLTILMSIAEPETIQIFLDFNRTINDYNSTYCYSLEKFYSFGLWYKNLAVIINNNKSN